MVKSGVDKSVDNFLTGQKVSCRAPTARQRRGVSGGGCAGNKLGKDVNAAAAVPEDERYLPASPDLVRLDAGTNVVCGPSVGSAFYRLSALERAALGFDDEAAYKQRKLSVLEQYFLLGVLDDEKSRYSAYDRLKAGRRLWADFSIGNPSGARVPDIAKVRVDGSVRPDAENAADHWGRYLRAQAAVSDWFWPVVRLVCVDNEPIRAEASYVMTRVRKAHEVHADKRDLRRGLEELINFYKQGA